MTKYVFLRKNYVRIRSSSVLQTEFRRQCASDLVLCLWVDDFLFHNNVTRKRKAKKTR